MGELHHDAQFEGKSADRFDARRFGRRRRRKRAVSAAGLASPPRATANRGMATEAPRATTLLARAATPPLAAVTMVAGIPVERPAIPVGTAGTASPATTSAGPATTRAASGGRRPGWGCGPAWASAASARGADRPQILRSPCGAPAWTYGLTRRRRRADQDATAGYRGRRPVRKFAQQSKRPGVTPVATRPFAPVDRTTWHNPAKPSPSPSACKSPNPTNASRRVTAARSF